MELMVPAFAIAGCFFGIATGLMPGLHVNTIALIALSYGLFDKPEFMAFIASMSVVHTFVDFVPSVLLGAPSDETFLSILPGHKLLLEGKGLVAVKLTIAGGLFAGIGAIILGPFFVLFVEKAQFFLSAATPTVLIAIIAAMILGEKAFKKKGIALLVVFLSGSLGFLALSSRLPLQQPLFCLATGFFGASTLIDSAMKKSTVAKQKNINFFVEKKRLAKNGLLALFGGCCVSLLPSIGASQAAFVVKKLVGKIKTSDYLILLGGVNTATMMLSFFMLFALGKTRTGSAAAISEFGAFGFYDLLVVVAACLLGLGFGAIATDAIAGKALKTVQRFDYRKINIAVLAFVTGLVAVFSGSLGLLFAGIAAGIGLFALNTGIKRSNCMAFLMIPTILLYIPLL